MPTQNDAFFSAASCKKDIIFGGHLKQISVLLISLGFSANCKSTKMMPNQLKKMKTESLQSSENLSESLKTEMNIPNLSTGSMQSSEYINRMAKVFILPNSNL